MIDSDTWKGRLGWDLGTLHPFREQLALEWWVVLFGLRTA